MAQFSVRFERMRNRAALESRSRGPFRTAAHFALHKPTERWIPSYYAGPAERIDPPLLPSVAFAQAAFKSTTTSSQPLIVDRAVAIDAVELIAR